MCINTLHKGDSDDNNNNLKYYTAVTLGKNPDRPPPLLFKFVTTYDWSVKSFATVNGLLYCYDPHTSLALCGLEAWQCAVKRRVGGVVLF
jgi:hypothetical protein